MDDRHQLRPHETLFLEKAKKGECLFTIRFFHSPIGDEHREFISVNKNVYSDVENTFKKEIKVHLGTSINLDDYHLRTQQYSSQHQFFYDIGNWYRRFEYGS